MKTEAVLRLETSEERHQQVVARLPAELTSAWRKGDPWRMGKVCLSSGANVFLAEGETVAEAVSRTLKLLERKEALFRDLAAQASMEVDFGVYLGGPEVSCTLSAEQLASFAKFGMSVRFSVYATSLEE